MLHNPHSTDAEAIRVLRTNLLFASVDHKLNSLLITSPTPGEGKSFIGSNLAVAFAQTGKRVILVDADLRKPTVHRIFGLVNNIGVTSALVSDVSDVEASLQATAVPELRVMTSGPLPPNPSELLSSHRMQDLLQQLQAHCDLVVIDSPPVLVVSDTAVLASHADGVLIAFSHDKLRRDPERNTIGALRQVQARILGVVLNRVEGSQHGYYYAYHKSYGNHYYATPYSARKQKPVKSTGVSTPPATRPSTNGAGAAPAAEPSKQMKS